ncbi:hypothetical protein VaNZ11_009153, partial [Volvox africanus]
MCLVILLLAVFFAALPVGTAEAVNGAVRHQRLLLNAYTSNNCAEAIANGLIMQNAQAVGTECICSNNTSVSQIRLALFVQDYLTNNQSCAVCQTSNDKKALTVTWLQYPGWHNGILTSWFRNFLGTSSTRVMYMETQQIPSPYTVTTASIIRNYTQSYADAGIISSDLSGIAPNEVVQRGKLVDFAENACVNESNPRGPLYPRTYLLMFYRADVLSTLYGKARLASVAPPSDWDSLLKLLEVHAIEAAVPGSSLPKYGLCLTTDANCGRIGDILAAIAASVVQTMGTHQGYVFDLSVAPPAAVPLVNGRGWQHAMELLRRLLIYNAPEYDIANGVNTTQQPCYTISPWFSSGDCLVTIDWDVTFRWMATASKNLTQQGVLRVAPLPGSSEVVKSNSTNSTAATAGGGGGSGSGGGRSELLKCSSVAGPCAVSANHDALYLTTAGQTASVVAAARYAHSACGPTEMSRMEAAAVAVSSAAASQGSETSSVVNRAPYSVLLDYDAYINYQSSGIANMTQEIELIQGDAARLFNLERITRQKVLDEMRGTAAASNGSANGGNSIGNSYVKTSWNVTTFPATPWWPGIGGDGVDIPAAALKPYMDAGLEIAAVKSYLQALWHAVNSPNAATDIPSPVKINWFKWALSHTAMTLRTSQSTDTTAAAELLVRLFSLAIEALAPAAVRSAYEAAIGAPGGAANEPQAESNNRLTGGIIAAIVTSGLAGVLFVAFVVGWLTRRLRGRQHDLLGRVLAPRAGQDTTLLISDVQNSTALWEQLPEEVMDIALKLHHNTFRRLLTRYDGYESGTEGDSFILAFSEPGNAVAFAAACQVDLLLQEWPQELLEQPDGEVVLVDPRDGEAAQQAAALTADLRRFANRASSGPSASLLSSFAVRLRASASNALRGTPISPQPSQSLPMGHGPYGPYPLAAAGGTATRGASMFDLSYDGHLCNGNSNGLLNSGRSRSVDFGAQHGQYGGQPGAAAAAAALLDGANGSQCGGSGGPAVHPPELLPMKSMASRGAPYSHPPVIVSIQSLNPRNGAALAPLTSGSCDVLVRPENLSVGGGSIGGGSVSNGGGAGISIGIGNGNCGGGGGAAAASKLFATRPERGGLGLSFPPPLLPTLREAPPSPWVVPRSSNWGAALQSSFPPVPIQEATAAVMGGQALKSLLVALPTGRVALVAYRGLRVRMGLHSGLEDPQHIVFNKVASAYKYQGPFAETARCTIDAAPGGMVVLSSQTFARLRHREATPGEAGTAPPKKRAPSHGQEALVLYAGHHLLRTTPPRPPPRPPAAAAAAVGVLRKMGSHILIGSFRASSAAGTVLQSNSLRIVSVTSGSGSGSGCVTAVGSGGSDTAAETAVATTMAGCDGGGGGSGGG